MTIKYLRKLPVILLWLILWQVISVLVKNPIFFPGPFSVLQELGLMLSDADFYASVLASLGRIIAGFLCAFVLAYALALPSGKFRWLRELLSPFITLCKTVPVASVVVLLLIWFGSAGLAFYITFMVVFPNIYIHVLEGMLSAPEDMLEMAKVFQLSAYKKYKYIYREAIWPHMESALKFSVGMSFKSGVAAEVIGLTDGSIGEGLYFDKIYLNTAGVFAWTFVIILLSFVSEKTILLLLRQLFLPGAEKCSGYRAHVSKEAKAEEKKSELYSEEREKTAVFTAEEKELVKKNISDNDKSVYKNNPNPNALKVVDLQNLQKSYHEKCLFENLSYQFETGKRYGIMGKSGCGKTTLLRILCGLTEADGGKVCYETDLTMQTEKSHDTGKISRQMEKSHDTGKISRQMEKSHDSENVSRRSVQIQNHIPVSMQFQENRLCEQYSAIENILLTYRFSRDEIKNISKLAEEVLGKEWAHRPVKELSGGMKRRVSFLRAICYMSPLLLLDEPFTGLDERTKAKMLTILTKFSENRIVIIAAHDETDLQRLDGKILQL